MIPRSQTRRRRRPRFCLHAAAAAVSTLALAGGCDEATPSPDDAVDLGALLADGGKADGFHYTAHIYDLAGYERSIVNWSRPDIQGRGRGQGRFAEDDEIFAYVLHLDAGAKIRAEVTASRDGEAMPTLMSVNRDYRGPFSPGEVLESTDDGVVSFAADGKKAYVLAITVPGDAVGADFTVDIACEGSEAQCGAVPEADCKPGRHALHEGAVITADTTWSHCHVELLGEVVTEPNATLEIAAATNIITHRLAGLTTNGPLDVRGTADAPVTFDAFEEYEWRDNTWRGLRMNGGGTIEHAVFQGSRRPLWIGENSHGVVVDSVFNGMGYPGNGVTVDPGADFVFQRALIQNYGTGVWVEDANDVRIEDSVIRDNNYGVYVEGGDRRRSNTCSDTVPAPRPGLSDPVIVHSDILDNGTSGIFTFGDSVLLQVEKSNILRNGGNWDEGYGVDARGPAMLPETYIRNSNVAFNGEDPNGVQVRTYQRDDEVGLVLDGNYYGPLDGSGNASDRIVTWCGDEALEDAKPSPDRIEDAGPRLQQLKPEVRDACEHAAD